MCGGGGKSAPKPAPAPAPKPQPQGYTNDNGVIRSLPDALPSTDQKMATFGSELAGS
jgi:hypothetical protein